MRELLTMWKSTRMVVLTAVCAACYVAVLLPFKIAVLVPGLTEVRPGAAVPVLMSLLFGPAAAWGAAIGNVVADLLGGMFGPGSFFGFVGNFLYGYLPYSLWRAFRGHARPGEGGRADWLLVAAVFVASCFAIASAIGWGVDLLGLAPFAALGNIILVNNLLSSLALALPLVALLYPRVERAGLVWHDVMDLAPPPSGRRSMGAVLAVAGAVAALAVGDAIAFGALDASFGAAGFGGASGTAAIGAGMAPFLILLAVGCALL